MASRIHGFYWHLASVAAGALLFVGGCGTLENGRGWGQDALWPIEGERVARAARDAFFHPGTLIPLAGAAIFAIDDFDERVSDWAVEHNPIFGSEDGADDASDYLRDALVAEAVVTALATPSGDTEQQWVSAKLKGGLVEGGALGVTGGLTIALKDITNRERPDREDDKSFPSGHASIASSAATLANRNLRWIDSPEPWRPALATINVATVGATAWARVEAGKHFPSDVLVGAALGHFLSAFIHDAFLNLPEDSPVDADVFTEQDWVGVEIRIRF